VNTPREMTFGESVFDNIENNSYLRQLFDTAYSIYSFKLFGKTSPKSLTNKEKTDLLKFADLLSKSNLKEKAPEQQILAQEISAMMNEIYPNDKEVLFYLCSVLKSCQNYLGMTEETKKYLSTGFLEDAVVNSEMSYLSIPGRKDEHFFPAQKKIYDGFSQNYFSYSAPTSLGKSFVMRVFIKEKIAAGSTDNFAILIPTKALINEVSRDVLDDLDALKTKADYRVVTSSGDILLDQKHCFVFVMTPERFLYFINTKTEIDVRYLFIDEAQKISSNEARSAPYYEIVDQLSRKPKPTNIFFSSPCIPNPDEYLKLIPSSTASFSEPSEEVKIQAFSKYFLAVKYSPVCQFKYYIDLLSGEVDALNDLSHEKKMLLSLPWLTDLNELIQTIGANKQNIVYCATLKDAVDFAVSYAKTLPPTQDKELLSMAHEIRAEIHSNYYLADLLEKGLAFHVGYLPTMLRLRIEKAFRSGKIRTLFCTSTLIEGVNLPADNLFVTSYKTGRINLSEVGFKNLIGRVGRINRTLFGNVFIIRMNDRLKTEVFDRLMSPKVPDQKLSIDGTLKPADKSLIVQSLEKGDIELSRVREAKEPFEKFCLMRTLSLIALNNSLEGKNSTFVMKELGLNSQKELISSIQTSYQGVQKSPGFDVSFDQADNLKDYIARGGHYPDLDQDGKIIFANTRGFLQDLYRIFKWDAYEWKTLGHRNLLGWYSGILNSWMSGFGTNLIVKHAINHKKENPDEGIFINNYKIVDFYVDNKENQNMVIADTLHTIENEILYSIANYFREFSAEYKRFHNLETFNNDWYEYVEYGTMEPKKIILERSGYTRESADFIISHQNQFMIGKNNSIAMFTLLKTALENCGDESVQQDTEDVFKNVPELFI
jgi:superfamily II DNA/RNA helicase